MKQIDNNKLEQITGGSASVGIFGVVTLAITAISVFVSGIFEGFTHPRGCNE